jgi:hypothetical protein
VQSVDADMRGFRPTPKEMIMKQTRRPTLRRPLSLLRTRVALAFRAMANAAEPATAQHRALQFYLSSGREWASRLV